MNGPPPQVVAASAYRRLLADDIAEAVRAGCSVAAVGRHGVGDVLSLAMVALGGSGIRVLALRPPWDSGSFIGQFAAEWRASGQDADLGAGAITVPRPSGERFALLLHQAHLIPPETLRHLERLAQAWPGMQMVFAGLPGIAATVQAAEYPILANRVSRIIETSLEDEMQRIQHGVQLSELADAAPASSTLPIRSTWISDEYPPVDTRPRAEVAPDQPDMSQPSLRRRALGRVVTWSLATLVAVAIMTTTALPRLPWSGRTAVPGTQIALTAPDPAPAPVTVPAENFHPATARPTVEQEPQLELTSPIAAASGQSAATENIPDEAAAAVETPAQAREPAQEGAPIAPVSSPPAASARPETGRHVETEESPGPVLRLSPSSPSSSSPSSSSPLQASSPSLSPAMADAMTRRGQAMLEIGDVSAARLLLARAAGAGSGPAALAMGTTFDAVTLERIGAVGIVADPVVAAVWYHFAIGLGEERARAMLDALPIDVVSAKPKDAP